MYQHRSSTILSFLVYRNVVTEIGPGYTGTQELTQESPQESEAVRVDAKVVLQGP